MKAALADGTVFDDSARHGGPQPMIAGQVIPGFAEALTKMQKGGKYKIHIPGNLAYGATPPPGSPFGPNADLDFDVHIVQIVPNAALMTGAGGAEPVVRAGSRTGRRSRKPSRALSRLRLVPDYFGLLAGFGRMSRLRSISVTFSAARIGSANSTPRIPNNAPISSCIASTIAGARSTVRRAM